MSTASRKLDEVLAPVLAHAKKVEESEPEKAAEIRRLAGQTRIELAKLEALALQMGCDDLFANDYRSATRAEQGRRWGCG